MEKTKVRVAKNNVGGFNANSKDTNLVQLDVGNLKTLSLSSLIEKKKCEFKNAATQTVSNDDVSLHLKSLQEKYDIERVTLELEFVKEKTELESKLTKHIDIVEKQNKLISELTNEKDFLWEEIRYLREVLPLVDKNTNFMQYDHDWDLEWDVDVHLKIPGKVTKPKNSKTMPQLSVQDREIVLCSIMSLRKQNLLNKYKIEKQALLDKVEIEKDLIRDAIASELEARYEYEIKNLNDTIDGLKEALADMKTQKNELAKIYQGERNALEVEFSRKEQELKDKMARELQRELVKAHQDWLNTKI